MLDRANGIPPDWLDSELSLICIYSDPGNLYPPARVLELLDICSSNICEVEAKRDTFVKVACHQENISRRETRIK